MNLQLALDGLRNVVQTLPTDRSSTTCMVAIFALAVSLVEPTLASKEVDARAKSVAERILSATTAISHKLKNKAQDSDKVDRCLMQLITNLERLAKAVESRTSQGKFMRVVLKSSIMSTIDNADRDVTRSLEILSLELDLENTAAVARLAVLDEESDLEKAIAQHRTEELNLIVDQLIKERPSSSWKPSTSLPTMSQIFYGRDDEMRHLNQLYSTRRPAYAAILGTGGAGKTSLGLSVLHSPKVISIFGKFRWFLSCEGITDAKGLLSGLASGFNVREEALFPELKKITGALDHDFLLMLDNFETPWEPVANRESVEDVLQKLADLPNLSLLITMRGAERPSGIRWTRPSLPSLAMLSHNAAKMTFTAISDVSEDEDGLDELLRVVDYLPLAITLMATQASLSSCRQVLTAWTEKKTAIVTRGPRDRLSTLDASVQVSLTCERFRDCPDAMKLLQVISLLPSGAQINHLANMCPEGMEVEHAISTILQVSLGNTNSTGRLRSLSPIREHIRLYHPMSDEMHAPLLDFYSEMAKNAKCNSYTNKYLPTLDVVSSEIHNMYQVFQISLQSDSFFQQGTEAVLNIAYFARNNYGFSSIKVALMNQAMECAKRNSLALQEAQLFVETRRHGIMLQSRDRVILDELNAAEDVFREAGNRWWIIEAHLLRGQILFGFRSFKEAFATTERLGSPALHTDDIVQVVHCTIYHAGALSQSTGRIRATIKMLRDAAMALDLREYPELVQSLWYTQAMIFLSKSRLSETLAALIKIDRHNSETFQSSLNSARILGATFMLQSRLSEATECIERAHSRNYAMQTSMEFWSTFYHLQAQIALGFGDALQAASLGHRILSGPATPYNGNHLNTNLLLARASLFSGDLALAQLHIERAQKCSGPKLAGIINCLNCRCDYYLSRGFPAQGMQDSILASVMAQKIQDAAVLAMSIQRAGDIFMLSEKDVRAARACYEAALEWIRYQGLRRHLADCLLRLGLSYLLEGDMPNARVKLKTSRRFYISAEDIEGFQYCEARLEDCNDISPKTLSDLPTMPLGTFLGTIGI